MSPLLAWLGAVLGLLLTFAPGPSSGVGPHPSGAGATTDAHSVRQPGLGNAAAPCTVGWSERDSRFQRSILASVVSVGSGAWAIGLTTLAEDPRYPLAARWDGTQWVEMPIAPSSAERALFGLDRSPTGRMWAAGYRARSSLYYPLMMRWSGSEWVTSPLGIIGSRGGALLSVRARTNALTWSVGYKIGSSGQRPMAIRRVGTEWRETSPTIPPSATGVLMDIDVQSGTSAWGVGWIADRSAPRPYLTRWNGRHWVSATPELAGYEGALTSVAISAPDDVWAVGYRVVSGAYKPLVEHWDGRRWRLVPFPGVHSEVALLRGVQIGSDGKPVVVGTRWDAPSGTWQGIAARRTDSEWHVMDMPLLPGGTELRDLATRDDGSAWVVGANGARSLAVNLCPEPQASVTGPVGTPTPQDPGTPGGVSPQPSSESSPPSSGDPNPLTSSEPGPTPIPTASATYPAATAAPPPTPRPSSKPRPRPSVTSRPRPTATPPVIVRDMAAAAGIAAETASYGAVRADFNADGWPDLFIGRHANPGWLLLNDHAGFQDAPGVSIPRRDRHGCTSGDANGDGLIDLYCANGAYHGAGFKANELYIQQPDGTFVDRSMDMHATDPFGRGRLAVMFDLDHDRYSDLFLADRPARTDGLPSLDRVLAAPGGTGYVARSLAGFDASGGADCLRAADLDRDGWTDIVLCERAMDRKDAYGIHILRNMKGILVDVTRSSGISKRQAVDAIVADMNGDGQPDIVEVTPYELRIHLRRNGGYVLGYSRPLRQGVAVAAGDVDGDGDRDLYIAQGSRTKQRADLMLLNRGNGRSFGTMAVPRAQGGSPESVTAIDYDRNGLTDFLVLNGKGAQVPGPVQLMAFFPRK